jgi:putative tricarboxylic transport membrane protein
MEANVFEALITGFISVFAWPTFGYMLVGIVIGFAVGILPGLGGGVALALMLPFTFDMTPVQAFAFLLGMHAVTGTTGDITSILFGVPGEVTSAALIVDGHPMAKAGQAGRALGAALMSSLVGALIGAFALAAAIPVVRPLVLAFGSSESFMLTIVGISFVAVLSGHRVLQGLIAGGLGLMLAMIGLDLRTGTQRYTFGQLHLWDGVGLVAVAVGIFAIPELYDLAVKGTSIADQRIGKLGGVLEGVKDTFRHLGLTIRCSLIGTFAGTIPGLGGAVAQWLAYAHAVQSSPNQERFGKGAIEGVLGPGAANNSKEGGNLIPTVAFGVPSTVTMAILLGAFLIKGLVPGREMLTTHLPLTMSFVWVVVVSNIITVTVCFIFIQQLAKITLIRGGLLLAPIILLVYIGAFAERNTMADVLTMLFFGLVGLAMVRFDWPRPPLALGLVLGTLAENNLYLATARYGADWLLRPIVLVLLALSLGAIAFQVIGQRHRRQTVQPIVRRWHLRPRAETAFSLAILLLVAGAVWQARVWDIQARLFPWVIGFPMLALLVVQFLRSLQTEEVASTTEQAEEATVSPAIVRQRSLNFTGWLLGIGVAVWLLGFPLGGTLGTLAYLRLAARESWRLMAAITIGTAAFFWIMVKLLNIPFPSGLLLPILGLA